MNTKELLDQLTADVKQIQGQAKQLRQYDLEDLQQQPGNGGWSVLQVLHHLNFYAQHYVNAMEKALREHRTQAQSTFTPGWFGDYFTRLIGPATAEKGITSLPAPTAARPPRSHQLNIQQLETFLQYQERLLKLLESAHSADLNRLRIPITISRWIRLKLGDTLRFTIGHEQRHLQQIERTLKEVTAVAKNSQL